MLPNDISDVITFTIIELKRIYHVLVVINNFFILNDTDGLVIPISN
jgi:hypothetical protein